MDCNNSYDKKVVQMKVVETIWSCHSYCYELLTVEFNSIILENVRHCGASLTEYTCRTWNNYMHMTVIRMRLNLRPQKIT